MKPERGKHETLNALAAVEDLSFSSVQPVKVNTYEFRRDGLLHLPVRDGGKLLPVAYSKCCYEKEHLLGHSGSNTISPS
jgi:hypothetical protein